MADVRDEKLAKLIGRNISNLQYWRKMAYFRRLD